MQAKNGILQPQKVIQKVAKKCTACTVCINQNHGKIGYPFQQSYSGHI